MAQLMARERQEHRNHFVIILTSCLGTHSQQMSVDDFLTAAHAPRNLLRLQATRDKHCGFRLTVAQAEALDESLHRWLGISSSDGPRHPQQCIRGHGLRDRKRMVFERRRL